MNAFVLSFGVIFLAELGDKSQLMALAFATRYPAIPVLVAISLATLLVHLGSVALGATVALALPTNVIAVVAGLAFLAFAAWTLRGDELGAGDEARAQRESTGGMVVADAIAIGVGRVLGRRLPDRTIRLGAAVAFVVFGAILIWQGLRG